MLSLNFKQKLVKLCMQYRIDIMYVFGSRAKEIKKMLDTNMILIKNCDSDVDIGIKLAKGSELSFRNEVILAQSLEELFDVSRVDLVNLSKADPFLAVNIIRGERLYANDEYLADKYDLYILRRAGDLAVLERERLSLIMDKTQ